MQGQRRPPRSGPGPQQPAIWWLPTWTGEGSRAREPRTITGVTEYIHVAGYRLNVVIPRAGPPRVGRIGVGACRGDVIDQILSVERFLAVR